MDFTLFSLIFIFTWVTKCLQKRYRTQLLFQYFKIFTFCSERGGFIIINYLRRLDSPKSNTSNTFHYLQMSETANDSNGKPSERMLDIFSWSSCAWVFVRSLELNVRDITRIHENDFADISSGNAKRCLTMTAIRCYVILVKDKPVRHFSLFLAEYDPFLIQLTHLCFFSRNDQIDKSCQWIFFFCQTRLSFFLPLLIVKCRLQWGRK